MTTPPAWCPVATKKPIDALTRGAGEMVGGPPRATHHTTEGSTASGAMSTYARTGNGPHLTIDYVHDIVIQHLPANVSATALRNRDGGVQTNRMGTVNIQIEWVGFAKEPFTAKRATAGPKVKAFLDWLRAWGIVDAWPMGAPQPYPASYGADNGDRNASIWATKAGHYGHSQVPENEHGDPGAINPAFVRQTAKPAPLVSAAAYHYTRLPLRRGDRNADVEHAQRRLIAKGFLPERDRRLGRRNADGAFGALTEAAVKAFQRKNGLADDGVVGPKTAAKLG